MKSICMMCGRKHGKPAKNDYSLISMWPAKCDWCGKNKPCCAPEDWGITPTHPTKEVLYTVLDRCKEAMKEQQREFDKLKDAARAERVGKRWS